MTPRNAVPASAPSPAMRGSTDADAPGPEVTTLENGFRVVSHAMPHLRTVSLGVWIGIGARHESDAQHGISHLLEHMAFKGTARRTAKRIAEEIEEAGGDLNASTSVETTAYYARMLAGDEPLAVDVLSDILLSSTFDADELKREQEVILHEIAASRDCPDDLVYDLFQEAAYPGQPLGRTILGTPESVQAMTSRDLEAYLAASYVPGRMVLSAAGAVDHERLVAAAAEAFGALRPGPPPQPPPTRYVGGTHATAKPFEQSHLLIGFDSPRFGTPDFYTGQVFCGLFGGGMSSRLFQEAREERGLCYAIYATSWGLSESGIFAVHAATSPELVAPLAELTAESLADIAAHGPTAAETERAKAQLKSGLLMSLESSFSRAEQMARHLLSNDRLLGADELIERVDAVTPEAIRAFAATLARTKPTVSVVGSGDDSRSQAEDTARRFEAMAG